MRFPTYEKSGVNLSQRNSAQCGCWQSSPIDILAHFESNYSLYRTMQLKIIAEAFS